MERSPDRRARRTKRMLRDALTELIEEKGVEAVTIKDLADRADISRGTFYIHYQDKYDLLEQSEHELLIGVERVLSTVDKLDAGTALLYVNRNQPFPLILRLAEYVLQHAKLLRAILGPKGNPSFHMRFKQVLERNLILHLDYLWQKGEFIVPKAYLIAYVISAVLGVMQYWLEYGQEQSVDEIALILSKATILGPGYVVGMKG